MIAYRHPRETIRLARALGRIRGALEALLAASSPDHTGAVRLLLEFGEFEGALADRLCPEVDRQTPLTELLRSCALLTGRAFLASWEGRRREVHANALLLDEKLAGLLPERLPQELQIGVAEGYAFYGLYPETYLEAARRLFRKLAPARAVVVGIRGIGTSLSAAVWAALEERGCHVRSLTLRPRGHPFDRRIALAPELARAISEHRDWPFLLVDEGPGLSGSSLCGAAAELVRLGVPESRLALLPSWEPDPDRLRSEAARALWPRLEKFTATFEEVWIESGRLARFLPAGKLVDVSGGQWRRLLYPAGAAVPAVHPSTERRKYVVTQAGVSSVLLKFAGLGRYGEQTYERARTLSHGGVGPRPLALTAGFIAYEFLPGAPLGPEDGGVSLADAFCRYLAFVREAFPATASLTPAEWEEMLRVNVEEALGREWGERLPPFPDSTPPAAVALDGRMLPHEWLRTRAGLLKTDGTDHCADHFFPGCTDLAWDVAGCLAEFAWGERRSFLERFTAATGERLEPRRLRFWSAAYLAFRTGFADLAASALPGTADGAAFAKLGVRYRGLLRQELAANERSRGWRSARSGSISAAPRSSSRSSTERGGPEAASGS